MKPSSRQLSLGGISAFMIAALAAVLGFRDVLRSPVPPADFEERIRWVTGHPADWRTASMVADAALDSDLPRRIDVWRSAFSLAEHLAPRRPNPPFGFVRGGLFHWYELAPPDRRRVLEVAAPLMRDERYFDRLHTAIWQVTRDMRWLRHNAPDTIGARTSLQAIAVRYGLFGDYRSLREELRRERLQELRTAASDAPVESLLTLLPATLHEHDEPLVQAFLHEVRHRRVNPENIRDVERLIDFAVRHDLKPLDGLRPLIEAPGKVSDATRARAALKMGDRALAERVEISTGVAGDPQWAPYFLERARAEATAGNEQRADQYLARAALGGITPAGLEASLDVARTLGREERVEELRRQLLANRALPRIWEETCSGNELCSIAHTSIFLEGPSDRATIRLSVSQSDEVPPYVEVYVDDELTAERAVEGEAAFEIRGRRAGLHRIEMRLVNRLTRNGVQRRLRLS